MSADIKIFTDDIEGQALNQCYTIAKSPVFETARIRIMPDVHAGKGCVIGFTATGMTKLIPNLVGVDIGCGMLTARLDTDHLDLAKLDRLIAQNVPAGFDVHGHEVKEAQQYLDEDGRLYLIIHTGSRNLGLQVANIYQDLAAKHCAGAGREEIDALIADLKAQGRASEISDKLKELKSKAPRIPEDLAWCSEADSKDYLHDAWVATRFARHNRERIGDIILTGMGITADMTFHTTHNYVDMRDPDHPVIRKGAVSAGRDEMLLIPMNMRDGCLLCRGLGNEDWNCSAPHGAGRLMSRSAAKASIPLEDFVESMKGIYTTSVCPSTLDESPFAYKNADSIRERIGETARIERTLKPIYNFKAH
jgi:tRNA-splicing ligase RtcB